MTGKRVTATIAALFVASALGAAPAGAAQGPLLSGYGGPGEGEQAILGSALIGGAKGGGASGGAGSAGRGSAGESSSSAQGSSQAPSEPQGGAAQTQRSAAPAPTHKGSSSTPANGHNGIGKATKRVAKPSGGAGAVDRAAPAPQLVSVDSSQPLGISNADFVYMLVALAGLVLTGVLTMQLARRSH
jgi:hypothetical protein